MSMSMRPVHRCFRDVATKTMSHSMALLSKHPLQFYLIQIPILLHYLLQLTYRKVKLTLALPTLKRAHSFRHLWSPRRPQLNRNSTYSHNQQPPRYHPQPACQLRSPKRQAPRSQQPHLQPVIPIGACSLQIQEYHQPKIPNTNHSLPDNLKLVYYKCPVQVRSTSCHLEAASQSQLSLEVIIDHSRSMYTSKISPASSNRPTVLQ